MKATELDFTPAVVNTFGEPLILGPQVDFRGATEWQIILQNIGGGTKLHITPIKFGFTQKAIRKNSWEKASGYKTVKAWTVADIDCGSKKTNWNGWTQSAQWGGVELSDKFETEWVSSYSAPVREAMKSAAKLAVEKYGDQVCSKCLKGLGA